MPYFTTVMARSIQDTPDSSDANNQMGTTSPTASVSTRTLRTMPGNGSNGSGLIYKDIDPQLQQRYRYEVTQRKLLFMRSLIRAQVNQLLTGAPPYSVEEAKKIFAEYHINRSNSLHEDANIAMYEASNPSKRDINLMVTIYTRRQLDPERSMYLKIINHLGRKHPFIIYTTDIFCDASHVYIFQELIPKGNVLMYLESRPAATIDEAQIRFWSKQLYQAMDFLGDQAIAHRNIAPNHLVMKPMGRETWIKLTGFKNAIIYWDVKRNDVRNCACLPAAQQKVDGANFQAPEVYGDTNTEEFDPIMADLWSYGANLYFIIARQYPFDLATLAGDQAAASPDNIDAQIWQNISRITWLSAEGKQFLFALLRINANDRIPFDFISHDPWLSVHTKISPKTVLQTPFKNLEKIKVARKSAGNFGKISAKYQ